MDNSNRIQIRYNLMENIWINKTRKEKRFESKKEIMYNLSLEIYTYKKTH